ncbi:MAG: serine hydrolase domain-containing protein [Arcanobacterium sp.]|nr:serine hydrolase domain-containing protein [Arcanobacterium sp.]
MRFENLPADSFTFAHSYAVLDPQQVLLLAGDPDEVYPLASVTKPIAAYAVLTLVAESKLRLDEEVKLPELDPSVTIQDLLAHTSGVPMLKGEALLAPRRRRIYSNYGFDLLAKFLTQRFGISANELIQNQVLTPLGMDTCEISGSIAYSGKSSLDSLMRFAAELLSPQLVSKEFLLAAVSPQFPGLPGILPGFGRQTDNLWGLGFELRGTKSPHWLSSSFTPSTFGHFGQSGSFLWVDPEINRAGVFLGELPFSEAHQQVWPGLTEQMRDL